MKIEITDVTDMNIISNANSYKIHVMDKMIEYFLPVFNQDIERQTKCLNEGMEDLKKLKTSILEIKTKLKVFLKMIEREEIKKNILTSIQLLIKKDLLYGKNKQIVKDVLLLIDNRDTNLKKILTSIKSITIQK